MADDDRSVRAFVIETPLHEGHAVFQVYNVLSAIQLAVGLKTCNLVISDTRLEGVSSPALIARLRGYLPAVTVLYPAHPGHSTPELEAQLPADVPFCAIRSRPTNGAWSWTRC